MKKHLIYTLIGLISFQASAHDFDRQQEMLISKTKFQKLTEKDFSRYVAEMKDANFYVEPDHRSKAIFERIKQQAILQKPEAKKWKWEFFGDLQSRFNAYGGVYGKVVLGTNLFDQGLFTDDELAFVIAHEVVHSIQEHAREKYNKNDGTVDYIKLSQTIELEADYLALDLVKRAGYDPKKSLGYLRKIRNFYALMKVEQGGDNSSHPSVAMRYDRLNEYLK